MGLADRGVDAASAGGNGLGPGPGRRRFVAADVEDAQTYEPAQALASESMARPPPPQLPHPPSPLSSWLPLLVLGHHPSSSA